VKKGSKNKKKDEHKENRKVLSSDSEGDTSRILKKMKAK
jgi:hypothetical protein